jgi:hypothetical protein
MTSPDRFPVIIPPETQSREFDAKLLLAGFLAERGNPVFVGSRPRQPARVAGDAGSVRRQAVRALNSYRAGRNNSRAYSEHRFSGLNIEDTQACPGRLSKVTVGFSKKGPPDPLKCFPRIGWMTRVMAMDGR